MNFNVSGGKVHVNVPTKTALMTEIASRLRQHRGFAVATLNLDHLVKLASPQFCRAYQAQDLVTADGNPIVWMSRLAGQPVELVTGADLIFPLARMAAKEGVRIGFLGSDAATLAAAKALMCDSIPGLEIPVTIAPPMGFAPDGEAAKAALAAFAAAGVQMVFVALGAPKQETFAAFGRHHAPGLGFVSIGAGLDFIAGTQRRAPVWAQRMAMEWLWRVLSHPRRLAKRYAQCMVILPRHIVEAVALRGAVARSPDSKADALPR